MDQDPALGRTGRSRRNDQRRYRAGPEAGRGAIARPVWALALALTFIAVPVLAAERDVLGWGPARWGMNAAALRNAHGGTLTDLPSRLDYGRLYADQGLLETMVGGLSFTAFFQMNADTGLLEQVLLERRRANATPAAFARLLADLEAPYGPPTETCQTPNAGGMPGRYALIWRLPTTTLHASFFDFSSTEVLERAPPAPAVPLSETVEDRLKDFLDERRVNHRFVPRRIILRTHASDNETLGRGCP
ncbi:MAG: hypothetical protein AAGF58_00790 [Pseudomonadota bacterium]